MTAPIQLIDDVTCVVSANLRSSGVIGIRQPEVTANDGGWHSSDRSPVADWLHGCTASVCMRWRRRRRCITALQETFFLNLLTCFCGRTRIQCFHFLELLGRQTGQLADKVNQVPCLFGALLGSGAPRWHPRQPYTVLDDVEQLTIAQRL